MADDVVRDRRLLEDNNLSAGPPGTDNDAFDSALKAGNAKDVRSSRRRNSRSKSPARRRRRSRSKSRTYSPDRRRRRFEERDPRLRNRRSRSRERRARNRSQSREGDNNRFRGRRSRSNSRTRRNWSPKKKGPVSPPPQQAIQPNFNIAPPGMYDDGGYGNYQGDMNYGQNSVYSPYTYPPVMPVGQTFPSYPPPTAMQPVPPGDDFQQQVQWNVVPTQMVQPTQMVPPPMAISSAETPQPPPIMSVPPPETPEEKQKRDAAVAQEKKNQRETLRKQRQDYKRRSNALKRELGILKDQREELQAGSEPPSPTTKGFLKENDRLQLQIENKIKTIENVIDMLSGIIGTEGSPSPPPPEPPQPPAITQSTSSRKSKKKSSAPKSDDDESSPERLKNKVIESLQKKKRGSSRSQEEKDAKKEAKREKEKLAAEDTVVVKERSPQEKFVEKIKPANYINYVHYDPEMHWCRICNVFPKTAKDYLTHLHSQEHILMQVAVESPWHDKPFTDELPTYPDAPSKRTPIRGLQFFIPSSGWYCKLCSIWMGDLHCASLHLKSRTHAAKYTDYSDQNPHFEVDWMADRQKSYELTRQSQLQMPPPPPMLSLPTAPISHSSVGPDSVQSAGGGVSRSLALPSSGTDGIPLQLQPISSLGRKASPINAEIVVSDKKKKKKKTKEERREKKKKKRSKRRRQSSSSSSSSSSSDSDEDSTTKDDAAAAAAQSIRVAMRNLLKQQSLKKQEAATAAAAGGGAPSISHVPVELEDQTGKWTVVQQAQTAPPPPPPTISENGASNNKRDDLMISQWNPHEPIISEKEKKLLEQLKGRLKNRSIERDTNSRTIDERSSGASGGGGSGTADTRRERSRERRRSRSRERNDRRGRRSRSRGSRRSRSRSRTPSRWSSRRRSRSRSHSRPRGRGRVEKPIVRYPEFRPRVPEKDKEKEREKERDRKRSSRNDGDDTTGGSSNVSGDKKIVIGLKKPTNKKLPFIGRMPVFKKQTNDEEPKKDENLTMVTRTDNTPTPVMYTVAPGPPTSAHGPTSANYQAYDNMQHMQMEDYDDLMPDPMQFVSLMGAPPPPPMVPPPNSMMDKNEPVLPPGIDEADADAVPKPISDAPLPRKGPLPQDFQDALSIIFPGEKKPIGDEEAAATNLPLQHMGIEQPDVSTATALGLIATDDQSQQSMDIYGSTFPYAIDAAAVAATGGVIQQQTTAMMMEDMSFAEDVDIPDIVVMPVTTQSISGGDIGVLSVAGSDIGGATDTKELLRIDPEMEKKLSRLDELNDLAMLGIDTDDLAAQCM